MLVNFVCFLQINTVRVSGTIELVPPGSDGVKARDPKARTTSIKVKAVMHKTKAKDKAPKAKVFKSRPCTTNKQNINVCCIKIIQYSAFTVKQ